MKHFLGFLERSLWGSFGLAIGLIVLFAALHMLRTNALTANTPVGTGADWVAAHTQNY